VLVSPTQQTPIGALLPDYDVGGEIGRGAMGVVHIGRHRHLDREVAIKELPPSLIDDADVRARFLAEARALARLDHPNVVPIYDFVDRDGHCLLVMEALRGGTLWDRFQREGLSHQTSVAVAIATANGVEHAHRNGVLHRDIKPENLLFASRAHLKVTDFGIAKVIGGDRTMGTIDGSVLGTPAYMAPEQAEGASLGPAADVYAIGAVLFELLSGQLPFEGDSPMTLLVQRIMHDAPDLRTLAPDVPEPIARTVAAALEREPTRRIGSASELAQALATSATESWGPDWASATDVELSRESTLGGSSSSITPGPPPETAETPTGPAPAPGTVPPRNQPHVTQPPVAVPHMAPVTVHPSSTHLPSTPVGAVDRRQLVDVASLIKAPGRVWPLALATVVAVLAAFGLAIGAPSAPENVTTSGPVPTIDGEPLAGNGVSDLDTTSTFRLGDLGADTARVHIDYAGVTIWTSDAVENGAVDVDLGAIGVAVAGPMQIVAESFAGTQTSAFAIRSDRRWFETAQVPVLTILMLLALSMLEFRLRSFRRGSVRITMLIGAGAAATVIAVAATLLYAQWTSQLVTLRELIPPAVAAAAAAVLGALARAHYARARRRKRARAAHIRSLGSPQEMFR
jgi:serine/threonine-protein kinase